MPKKSKKMTSKKRGRPPKFPDLRAEVIAALRTLRLRHMRPARGRGARGVSKKFVSYKEISMHLGRNIHKQTLITACKGLSRWRHRGGLKNKALTPYQFTGLRLSQNSQGW